MEKLRTKYTHEANCSKSFKSKQLHVDEIYKEARNAVPNIIRKKKKPYFEEKLNVNTANPKNFGKN